jgi:signal transduction histidine kinase
MTPPSARLAWTLALASLALIAADTVIVAGSIGLFSTQSVGIHGWPLVDIAAGGCAVLGAVIVQADRRQPIGWLLNVIGFTTSLSMVGESFSRWVLFEGGPGRDDVAEVVGSFSALTSGSLALAALAVTFLLIPDGHLMARGWRWVIVAAALGYATFAAGVVLVGPHAISTRETDTTGGHPVSAVLFTAGILVILAALLASVTCLGIRLRRSHGQVRRQVRIVAIGAASVGLGLIVLLANEAVHGGTQQVWSSLVLYASFMFLVVCIAVAVLRYRLYDVELIISRGLVVAVAAAFAAAGYVGLVVALGRAAGHSTGGFWASLVAMSVVALAFQPLRKAVVRLADRLAYGARAAPYDALATFSRRIGRSPAPGAVLPAIAAAAGQTVAAERVLVRLDVAGGSDVVETWPTGQEARPPSGPMVAIADEHGRLGSITIDLPAGRDLRPFEERMLSDIAEQAAVAFRNVRLQVELAARVEQLDERARALTASRRRIIEAADTERQRLEAALAREVLPAMTALRRDLLEADIDPTEPTVARYVDRATGALEALRELTRGIYPTLLTRSGLAAALTAFADRRGLTGRLSVDPGVATSRYSDRVEAAAYFCCLEALAHVRPAASVTVDQVGDRLVVTVRGSQVEGLDRLGMSDRVEAAEGLLDESGDLLTIDLPAVSAPTSPAARRPAGARG